MHWTEKFKGEVKVWGSMYCFGFHINNICIPSKSIFSHYFNSKWGVFLNKVCSWCWDHLWNKWDQFPTSPISQVEFTRWTRASIGEVSVLWPRGCLCQSHEEWPTSRMRPSKNVYYSVLLDSSYSDIIVKYTWLDENFRNFNRRVNTFLLDHWY